MALEQRDAVSEVVVTGAECLENLCVFLCCWSRLAVLTIKCRQGYVSMMSLLVASYYMPTPCEHCSVFWRCHGIR